MRLSTPIFIAIIVATSMALIYLALPSKAESCLDLMDLSRPELSDVRRLYDEGKQEEALSALKEYYINRTGIRIPDEDQICRNFSEKQKTIAQNALQHRFTVLDAYGAIDYGKDIDWEHWPIKDLELRLQLHRMYWWPALGKAYRHYQDEKYAEEWIEEYKDWIKKNPLENYHPKRMGPWLNAENQYFAWRPLETGIRLKSQVENFIQMRDAKCFTPGFLDTFLVNIHRHMKHLDEYYTPTQNHRLTEAQGMLYASLFFPEFKASAKFRDKAIQILNEEICKQVYDDGMQIELDPGYHFIAIKTFQDAVRLCSLNDLMDVFPASYLCRISNMIDIGRRFIYPDYTLPVFSDTRQISKSASLSYLKSWDQIFPKTIDSVNSKAYSTSGFYFLCNGWDMNSTIMSVKAGPPATYHCQPDNGTFEYWRKGRNFLPDSGCYVFSGDKSITDMRNWFRQTRVHNTLTLDGKDLETTDSKLIDFQETATGTKMKVQNQSYHDLLHERQIFFSKDGSVEIIDNAIGDAEGEVQIHYNLSAGDWILDGNEVLSRYSDGNNISIAVSSSSPIEVRREAGRISQSYGDYTDRPAYSFNVQKKKGERVSFKTIITPLDINNR